MKNIKDFVLSEIEKLDIERAEIEEIIKKWSPKNIIMENGIKLNLEYFQIKKFKLDIIINYLGRFIYNK